MTELGRYARTVSHLTPWQVGWRVVYELRSRAYRSRPEWFRPLWRPDPSARIGIEPLARPPRELLLRERMVAELWRSGKVRYLGTEADRLDWSAAGRPRLWSFERQYHSELVALAALASAEPGEGWEDEARTLVTSWAAACPPPAGDAWQPYPVARRLLSWSLAAALEPPIRETIAPLVPAHLRFLRGHLEYHLLGNHLLCNACALMAGGAVLDSPLGRVAVRAGEALLVRELKRQVLTDGGYAERTVQYHAIVLRDVLIALGLTTRAGYDCDPRIAHAAIEMCRWLSLVRRVGGLPWLNDAAPDATPDPAEVLSLAAAVCGLRETADSWLGRAFGGTPRATEDPPRGDVHLRPTGWAILRQGETELLFDHGPIGPDEQPGHGHSDALSYELIWEGTPVVCDTGVTTYEANDVRAFERSARAHACVTVGGNGPDELWGAFRVAARGTVDGSVRALGQMRVLRGTVVSPRRWTHERGIVFVAGVAVVVFDNVTGSAGRDVLSHVPLAEQVIVSGEVLRAGPHALHLCVLRGAVADSARGRLAPRDGWVGCGFGVARPRTTISIRADATARVAYAIASARARVSLEERRCVIQAPGVDAQIPLTLEGLPA